MNKIGNKDRITSEDIKPYMSPSIGKDVSLRKLGRIFTNLKEMIKVKGKRIEHYFSVWNKQGFKNREWINNDFVTKRVTKDLTNVQRRIERLKEPGTSTRNIPEVIQNLNDLTNCVSDVKDIIKFLKDAKTGIKAKEFEILEKGLDDRTLDLYNSAMDACVDNLKMARERIEYNFDETEAARYIDNARKYITYLDHAEAHERKPQRYSEIKQSLEEIETQFEELKRGNGGREGDNAQAQARPRSATLPLEEGFNHPSPEQSSSSTISQQPARVAPSASQAPQKIIDELATAFLNAVEASISTSSGSSSSQLSLAEMGRPVDLPRDRLSKLRQARLKMPTTAPKDPELQKQFDEAEQARSKAAGKEFAQTGASRLGELPISEEVNLPSTKQATSEPSKKETKEAARQASKALDEVEYAIKVIRDKGLLRVPVSREDIANLGKALSESESVIQSTKDVISQEKLQAIEERRADQQSEIDSFQGGAIAQKLSALIVPSYTPEILLKQLKQFAKLPLPDKSKVLAKVLDKALEEGQIGGYELDAAARAFNDTIQEFLPPEIRSQVESVRNTALQETGPLAQKANILMMAGLAKLFMSGATTAEYIEAFNAVVETLKKEEKPLESGMKIEVVSEQEVKKPKRETAKQTIERLKKEGVKLEKFEEDMPPSKILTKKEKKQQKAEARESRRLARAPQSENTIKDESFSKTTHADNQVTQSEPPEGITTVVEKAEVKKSFAWGEVPKAESYSIGDQFSEQLVETHNQPSRFVDPAALSKTQKKQHKKAEKEESLAIEKRGAEKPGLPSDKIKLRRQKALEEGKARVEAEKTKPQANLEEVSVSRPRSKEELKKARKAQLKELGREAARQVREASTEEAASGPVISPKTQPVVKPNQSAEELEDVRNLGRNWDFSDLTKYLDKVLPDGYKHSRIKPQEAELSSTQKPVEADAEHSIETTLDDLHEKIDDLSNTTNPKKSQFDDVVKLYKQYQTEISQLAEKDPQSAERHMYYLEAFKGKLPGFLQKELKGKLSGFAPEDRPEVRMPTESSSQSEKQQVQEEASLNKEVKGHSPEDAPKVVSEADTAVKAIPPERFAKHERDIKKKLNECKAAVKDIETMRLSEAADAVYRGSKAQETVMKVIQEIAKSGSKDQLSEIFNKYENELQSNEASLEKAHEALNRKALSRDQRKAQTKVKAKHLEGEVIKDPHTDKIDKRLDQIKDLLATFKEVRKLPEIVSELPVSKDDSTIAEKPNLSRKAKREAKIKTKNMNELSRKLEKNVMSPDDPDYNWYLTEESSKETPVVSHTTTSKSVKKEVTSSDEGPDEQRALERSTNKRETELIKGYQAEIEQHEENFSVLMRDALNIDPKNDYSTLRSLLKEAKAELLGIEETFNKYRQQGLVKEYREANKNEDYLGKVELYKILKDNIKHHKYAHSEKSIRMAEQGLIHDLASMQEEIKKVRNSLPFPFIFDRSEPHPFPKDEHLELHEVIDPAIQQGVTGSLNDVKKSLMVLKTALKQHFKRTGGEKFKALFDKLDGIQKTLDILETNRVESKKMAKNADLPELTHSIENASARLKNLGKAKDYDRNLAEAKKAVQKAERLWNTAVKPEDYPINTKFMKEIENMSLEIAQRETFENIINKLFDLEEMASKLPGNRLKSSHDRGEVLDIIGETKQRGKITNLKQQVWSEKVKKDLTTEIQKFIHIIETNVPLPAEEGNTGFMLDDQMEMPETIKDYPDLNKLIIEIKKDLENVSGEIFETHKSFSSPNTPTRKTADLQKTEKSQTLEEEQWEAAVQYMDVGIPAEYFSAIDKSLEKTSEILKNLGDVDTYRKNLSLAKEAVEDAEAKWNEAVEAGYQPEGKYLKNIEGMKLEIGQREAVENIIDNLHRLSEISYQKYGSRLKGRRKEILAIMGEGGKLDGILMHDWSDKSKKTLKTEAEKLLKIIEINVPLPAQGSLGFMVDDQMEMGETIEDYPELNELIIQTRKDLENIGL